jgi:hypothetical protein
MPKTADVSNDAEHGKRMRVVVVPIWNEITDILIETVHPAARGEDSCDTSVKAREDRHREIASSFLEEKIWMR